MRQLLPLSRRDVLGLLGLTAARIVVRAVHTAVITVLIMFDVLARMAYWLLVLIVTLLNWLGWWVADLVEVITEALRVFVTAIGDTARYVVTPTAGIIAAAGWSASFAGASLRYLDGGRLPDLLILCSFGLVAGSALTAVWLALCGLPLSKSWPSMIRFVGNGSGPILVLVVFGGWIVDAAAAWSGVAPFRPGWLTIGTTVFLAFLTVFVLARRRTPSGTKP